MNENHQLSPFRDVIFCLGCRVFNASSLNSTQPDRKKATRFLEVKLKVIMYEREGTALEKAGFQIIA